VVGRAGARMAGRAWTGARDDRELVGADALQHHGDGAIAARARPPYRSAIGRSGCHIRRVMRHSPRARRVRTIRYASDSSRPGAAPVRGSIRPWFTPRTTATDPLTQT